MAIATFDTHKFIKKLQASGMPEKQAEAVVDAVRESNEGADLVTRKDMQIEFQKLEATTLAPMKADILLLKWMLGFVFAGVLALVTKAFFGV
jgi:hypothetical protein